MEGWSGGPNFERELQTTALLSDLLWLSDFRGDNLQMFFCQNQLNLHIFIKNQQNALYLSKTCFIYHTSLIKM